MGETLRYDVYDLFSQASRVYLIKLQETEVTDLIQNFSYLNNIERIVAKIKQN